MLIFDNLRIAALKEKLSDLYDADLRENGEFYFNDAHRFISVVSISSHAVYGEKIVIASYDVASDLCNVTELDGTYDGYMTLNSIVVCDDESEAKKHISMLFAQNIESLDMSV